VGRPVALKFVGPLFAVIWKLKAWLMVPVVLDTLVITGGVGLTVIVRGDDPEPDAFVAVTLAVEVPAVVGVPEMRPVELIAKPGGSPVAPKLVGELVAPTWKLKA
jgi:hypothetical protein